MSYSRYDNRKIVTNTDDSIKDLLLERGINSATHYTTPVFIELSQQQLRKLKLIGLIWNQYQKFYKLANTYYGDPKFWWVIAKFNKKPTEFHVQEGEVIYIPTPLDTILQYYNSEGQ
jgi:hypothetical protein